MKRLLCTLILILTCGLHAVEKDLPSIKSTELTLQNGMRICIKATDFESDEVLIHAFAPGGLASFPASDRASAELSPQIAIKSGDGTLSHEQLSDLFESLSIDYDMKIEPFSRVIDGSCPKEQLEVFFREMSRFLAKEVFTEESLKKVLKETEETLSYRDQDPETFFDREFKKALLPARYSDPLSKEEMKNLSLEKVSSIYKQSFQNPSDFVVIIVGDLEKDVVRDLAQKYLGGLKPKEAHFPKAKALEHSFQSGERKKIVFSPNHKEEAIVRIAIPLQFEPTPNEIQNLDLLCQIIETRLRNVMKTHFRSTHGIDVAYEFPFYPEPNLAHLTLQFRCPDSLAETIETLIKKELQTLSEKGPKTEEIETAKTLLKHSQEFWKQENSYWLSEIAHCYKWNWDPEVIRNKNLGNITLDAEQVKRKIHDWLLQQNQRTVILKHA